MLASPDALLDDEIRLRSDYSKIPNNFDFNSCKSLSLEAREKLSFVKPETLGQASRISGVSPSDVAVLSVLVSTK